MAMQALYHEPRPHISIFEPLYEAIQRRETARLQAIASSIEWINRIGAELPRLPRQLAQYRPPIRYNPSINFSLDNVPEANCIEYMRFSKEEIRRVVPLLHIDEIQFRHRYSISSEKAFCILLYRLAGELRWKDLCLTFGMSRSALCSIFWDVLLFLYHRYRQFLFWDDARLTYRKILFFRDVITYRGGRRNIWCFVDGTIRRIARPRSFHQRLFYTGRKGYHGFNVSCLTTPDGLISSISEPYEGKKNDWQAYLDSGVPGKLRHLLSDLSVDERPLIFGDKGYNGDFGIVGMYKRSRAHSVLTPSEEEFNEGMAVVRAAVEDTFTMVVDKWRQNDRWKVMRTGATAVGPIYVVSVFLTNIMTCLTHGNQVSDYFECSPPTVEQYLHGI
jgi:hypothetical protein